MDVGHNLVHIRNKAYFTFHYKSASFSDNAYTLEFSIGFHKVH